MNTQDSKELPELLEHSALRKLQDDELRGKAVKVISEKNNWRFMLIWIPGGCLTYHLVPLILNALALRLTPFDQGLLFMLATCIPFLLAQVMVMQRKLDAAIQLLQLNEKMNL